MLRRLSSCRASFVRCCTPVSVALEHGGDSSCEVLHRRYSSAQEPAGDGTTHFGFRQVREEEKEAMVDGVFSSVAAKYDLMNDIMSGGLHRLWKDRMVQVLRPFPGMHHLDVAGGTGDIAFRVLRAIRAAEMDPRMNSPHSISCPNTASSAPPETAATTATAGAAGVGASAGSTAGRGTGGGPGAGGAGPSGGAGSTGGGASEEDGEEGEGRQSRVVVCDINAAMLEVGRQRAQEQGLAIDPALQFVEGNAEDLAGTAGIPDRSMDAYTIAFGIRNVTHIDAALREAHRVLKKGGRFLCLELSHLEYPALQPAYDMYSFAIIPTIGQLVTGDRQSYQYLVESIRKFPPQREFASRMEQAGFSHVTYENMTGGVVALHSGFKL